MLNDFRNRDFWITKQEDETTYYLRVKGKWIKIAKEVYAVYKNSYQKMYREYQKNDNFIELTESVERRYVEEINPLDIIVINDMKRIMHMAIEQLTEDEQMIVYRQFFDGLSERQLAAMMGLSKTAVHYRKKKILEKLRIYIDQYID